MDPRDSQQMNTPGQAPGEPGPAVPAGARREVETPVVARRMDPRLWALLPVIALAILGAYILGKGFRPEKEAAPPVTTEQPIVAAPPPPAPKGNISVTEVPVPAATPTPPPAPPVLKETPPAPRPAKKRPFHQEEPAVVLPPAPSPEPPVDESAPTIMPPEPPADQGGQTPPGDTGSQGEPDRDPVRLNDPALEYPSSAYEDGVEGTTRVSFTVDADGRVQDPSVSQSSGDSRLDQAAMDYVRRLRFRPAIRNGKPSTVRANRNVRFQLR